VFIVELDAALKILWVPLLVLLLLELLGSFPEEVILATQKYHRVRVDVGLELGGVLLCQLFWVDFFRSFLLFNDLVALLVELLRLGKRLLRRYVEDFIARHVADRVAIEDIASILAIVLAQSPAEGLAEHLLGDLLLTLIALVVFIDLSF